jgi:hypothetical protein
MEEVEVIFHGGAGDETVGGLADGDPLSPSLLIDLGRFKIGVCIPPATPLPFAAILHQPCSHTSTHEFCSAAKKVTPLRCRFKA